LDNYVQEIGHFDWDGKFNYMSLLQKMLVHYVVVGVMFSKIPCYKAAMQHECVGVCMCTSEA